MTTAELQSNPFLEWADRMTARAQAAAEEERSLTVPIRLKDGSEIRVSTPESVMAGRQAVLLGQIAFMIRDEVGKAMR